jgi:type IV fimbrial biogenesis protein FimT
MEIARHKRRGARHSGFTLIELMVTVTVAAVLLAIAVPSFSRLIASNRLATQTNEFVGGLNLARTEAVRQGQGVSIRSDSAGIDFGTGWKVFKDPTSTGAAPAAADVIRHATTPAGRTTLRRVTLASGTYTDATSSLTDRMYVAFNARGGNNAGGSAYFRVCDATNSALPGRVVQVTAVGRVTLASSNAACT